MIGVEGDADEEGIGDEVEGDWLQSPQEEEEYRRSLPSSTKKNSTAFNE